MDDYKKLHKQPLKFVLAEFRFSPVMQIAEYIPKIQEALRKQYPIPEKKTEQVIQVQQGGVAVSTLDRWSFVTGDKRNAIEINQERLIYCTSDYLRFDGFSEFCEHVLKALAEIVEPSLILRIGLRYSDLITIDEDEDILQLIDPSFIFPSCVSELGDGMHQRSETLIKTESGVLAIRSLYGHHDLLFMPDIKGLPVHVEKDESPSERMILDFDHFWEAKDEVISFEVDEILSRLQNMHEISRKAFWKITTDYARNQKWA